MFTIDAGKGSRLHDLPGDHWAPRRSSAHTIKGEPG